MKRFTLTLAAFALVALVGVAFSQDIAVSNYNNGQVLRFYAPMPNIPALAVPTAALKTLTIDTNLLSNVAKALGSRTAGTRRVGLYCATNCNYGYSDVSRTSTYEQSIGTATWVYFAGKQADIEALYLNPQGTSAATVTVYIREYTN